MRIPALSTTKIIHFPSVPKSALTFFAYSTRLEVCLAVHFYPLKREKKAQAKEAAKKRVGLAPPRPIGTESTSRAVAKERVFHLRKPARCAARLAKLHVSSQIVQTDAHFPPPCLEVTGRGRTFASFFMVLDLRLVRLVVVRQSIFFCALPAARRDGGENGGKRCA